jgi:hypothetical protein
MPDRVGLNPNRQRTGTFSTGKCSRVRRTGDDDMQAPTTLVSLVVSIHFSLNPFLTPAPLLLINLIPRYWTGLG